MRMKIRVKIMDQTDHHFDVDDQMLLSDFRLEVAERLHIPPERQRMIFAGHVLKIENNTLSACGLRDGHVVHVVERPANMPFPPNESDSNTVNDRVQHSSNRHSRFFQNMFGTPMNGRERITYVIPFERNGVLSENAHIEELIQSALDGLTFLTSDQRRRINSHWQSNSILHISLPTQRVPHIASPSFERVALIDALLEQIAHFYRIVEIPGGLADRIDEFLDGSHTYSEENTIVFNEQLRVNALSLEREPLVRSRLIDQLGSEQVVNESDEHEARFQRVEETNGNAAYVMRHAITIDLLNILRRVRDECERIRPHMIRLERILSSRILYNIDDAEHTDTDYRANFFTVYMEHMQRLFHRLSHAWHLTSDLGVYLHNPMPRRLIPNYQNFQWLPPTEGEIVLEFRPPQENSEHTAVSEPVSRFLDVPPPGSDVQELTSDEVRIIGLNPTVRRMQQMGIAVPIPVTAVGHVNVQSGVPTQPRMVVQRHSTPLYRTPSVSWSRNPISGMDSSFRAVSARPPGFTGSSMTQSDTIASERVPVRQSSESYMANAESSDGTTPLSRVSNQSSLEEALIRTIEHSQPSSESPNPYERFMRFLLQSASDSDFDISGLFRSIAIQQAFNRAATQPERGFVTDPVSQQSSHSSAQPDQQPLVPSLGSLARGVITQSGSQVPFMSEVISNIMRSNGINGAGSPQVDVILEYGEGDTHHSIDHMQPQLSVSSGSMPAEQRTHPAAVGYHVEVHQFDVFTHPVEPDSSTQVSSQNNISSNVYTPSTSSNYSGHSNVGGSSSLRSGFAHGRQRQLGTNGNLPLFMGNLGFPSEMHVTAPRQEVVSVDPFLSCTSRFTDVQRVLRSSYPSNASNLSPYRRFMRNTSSSSNTSSPLDANRRATPVDIYENMRVTINSSGDVVATDEDDFESFIRLAVRSAMSQMLHSDQDRNAQNARGIAPHVFSVAQSVQTSGGGEVVEATISAPILVHAEVETHSEVPAGSTSANESLQNNSSTTSNDILSDQNYGFILREDESRNILTEIANSMTAGFETRLVTILDASGAPTSLLRPGNGAGVLLHLEALLLNFATLGDLSRMMNLNMTPLESHRSRFRAHVIENQLNGNSTPSDEDLFSASERLAAHHSSIASVICAAGGELERVWNGRRMSIPRTMRNIEIAAIQQLLRALLNRTISDAEFSRRIQNILRDYVRHLVALGNYSFDNAEQTAYVRIAYELLVHTGRTGTNADANLTRLLHLRNFVLPRISAVLREQGPFPNLDEIPSRLLVWADDFICPGAPSRANLQLSADDCQVYSAAQNGVDEEYHDMHDEPKPSTSHGYFEMPSTIQTTGIGQDAMSSGAQLRDYDGDWRRSFPDWIETIEWDALSGQTNPRRFQNLSDVYQMGHPEHARRQVVSEHASEEDVLSSAVQEIVGNVFHGNIPTTIRENMSSVAVISALSELLDLSIQHRIQEDCDYDSVQYPNVDRQFRNNHKLL